MKPLIFLFLIILFQHKIHAQLCTGSLGDPVVNVTFGDGSTNTSGYTATNAYTYTSSFCPNDGYYTITKTSTSCFNNTWHTVTQDHTGNGAFLLVNATFTAGDFLVTTVRDLCPNTTYEFAAWLLNIMNRVGIKPNITFSIETTSGTILQQFATGDIPETSQPTWKQYGFFFTVPNNTSDIVLRMTNNAPGGFGNDIGIDDITFRPCSNVTLQSTIFGNSDTVRTCDNNTNNYILTSSITNGYSNPVYQWQISTDTGRNWRDIIGANNSTFNINNLLAGNYIYRITVNEFSTTQNSNCRIASNNVMIDIQKTPIVNAGSDRFLVEGNSLVLDGKVISNYATFQWSPNNYLSSIVNLNAIATPIADKQYTLTATTTNGCISSDDMFIKVVKDLYVPNSFTPNNDGINDYWEIPYLTPDLGATVQVFSRYGQILYSVTAKEIKWNGTFKGKLQPSGTYIYKIILKNKKTKSGYLMLLN